MTPPYYTGIDASRPMLAEARRKHAGAGRRFLHLHAEDWWEAIAPGTFDTACTFWSFSYFSRPRAVLSSMHSALRRGGRVVIHAYAPRYKHRPSYILGDCEFNTFSPEELELLLYGAGFRDVLSFPFRVLGDGLIWRLPVPLLRGLISAEMKNLPTSLGMTYVLTAVK